VVVVLAVVVVVVVRDEMGLVVRVETSLQGMQRVETKREQRTGPKLERGGV
jgi:hypothetical protein